MLLNIMLSAFLVCSNCCDNDLKILKKISKSEKKFYSNHILPKSFGNKIDRKSYRSIIKRKTIVREQVLSEIAKEKNGFNLVCLDTFYLAEGADGAYAYGYLWNSNILISYSYDPASKKISVEELDRNHFFNTPEGFFLRQVDKWDIALKEKPMWSNSSLMGGLLFFVSRVVVTDSDCKIETIALHEFRN